MSWGYPGDIIIRGKLGGIRGGIGNLLIEVKADIASGALLSSRKDSQVSSKAMHTVSFLALLARAKRKKGWIGEWVMWKTNSGKGRGMGGRAAESIII